MLIVLCCGNARGQTRNSNRANSSKSTFSWPTCSQPQVQHNSVALTRRTSRKVEQMKESLLVVTSSSVCPLASIQEGLSLDVLRSLSSSLWAEAQLSDARSDKPWKENASNECGLSSMTFLVLIFFILGKDLRPQCSISWSIRSLLPVISCASELLSIRTRLLNC